MEKQLTSSQKRNRRRTTSNRVTRNKSFAPPSSALYAVGDTVIVESHDRDDYLMEENNWEYKGYIEKVYTQLRGIYVYYIIRTETPISFEALMGHVDTKIWPAAKENCTFSRKRYGDKFLGIIASQEGITDNEEAEKESEEYQDYTTV